MFKFIFIFIAVANMSFGDLVNIPNMFNTGVSSTTGEVIAFGERDSNYKYSSTFPATSLIDSYVHDSAYPINPNGPWAANNSSSLWISDRYDSNSSPSGWHFFHYSYSLEHLDPNTAEILGSIAADNGFAIIHNSQPIVSYSDNNFNFVPFEINDQFQEGDNVITFAVRNLGTSPNPMALRVEFNSATAYAIPEPSSLASLIVGTLGILKLRRRI